MRLWLARHAELAGGHAGCCYGRLEVAADGAATERAARRLHGQLPTLIDIRCSPSERCMALAQALRQHRPALAWQEAPDLLEMDFGEWEGRPWDEIGEGALRSWTDDFASHRPGGGESVSFLMARVSRALAQERGRTRDVLWITHAGVIRAARLLLSGIGTVQEAAQWPRDPVPHGGLEVHPLPVSGPAAAAPA